MMHQYNNFLDSTWVQTYKSTDQTWLADSLNWEKLSGISTLDTSFLTFLHNSSFINQHLTLDYSLKMSYLDIILITSNSVNYSASSLYVSYINDLYNNFSVLYLPLLSLFSSSYQDVYSLVMLVSPEVIIAFADYFNLYHSSSFINAQVSACFDSYTNNLNYIFGEGILSLFMFLFFAWLLIYFFTVNSLLTWSTYNYSQFARLYLYFFSMSRDTRLQFEVVLQTAIFFFFIDL